MGVTAKKHPAADQTPEQRDDSARNAVQARRTKTKPANPSNAPTQDTSRNALHVCLKKIKAANDEAELRRLAEELQRIIFYRQYQNAED